jgi:hypothetical protein
MVVHKEPAAPRSLDSKLPRDVETICLKCLEKEPDYSALRREVEGLLAGRPNAAVGIPRTLRIGVADAARNSRMVLLYPRSCECAYNVTGNRTPSCRDTPVVPVVTRTG